MLKSSLNAKHIQLKKFISFEVTAILINVMFKIRLVCVYRRDCVPFSTFKEEFSSFISDSIDTSIPFIICGDFNIHWNIKSDIKTTFFKDLLDEYGIVSCTPDSKTHISGNTIDFILVDAFMHSFISDVSVDENEVLSDHFPVTFNCLLPIKTSTSKPNEVKFSRKLSSIVIELFKLDLKLALAHNFPHDGSFDELYSAFTLCLSKAIDDHAPLRPCKIAYSQRPNWMDNEYVKARALRRKLEKRYRSTQNEDDRLLYVTSDLCVVHWLIANALNSTEIVLLKILEIKRHCSK